MGALRARTPLQLSWSAWVVIAAVLLVIVAAAALYVL